MKGNVNVRCIESREGYIGVSLEMTARRVSLIIGVLAFLLVGFYFYQGRAEERASCLLLLSVPGSPPPPEKAMGIIRVLIGEYPACTRYASTAYYRMVKE